MPTSLRFASKVLTTRRKLKELRQGLPPWCSDANLRSGRKKPGTRGWFPFRETRRKQTIFKRGSDPLTCFFRFEKITLSARPKCFPFLQLLLVTFQSGAVRVLGIKNSGIPSNPSVAKPIARLGGEGRCESLNFCTPTGFGACGVGRKLRISSTDPSRSKPVSVHSRRGWSAQGGNHFCREVQAAAFVKTAWGVSRLEVRFWRGPISPVFG